MASTDVIPRILAFALMIVIIILYYKMTQKVKKNRKEFIYQVESSNKIELYFENWNKLELGINNRAQIGILRAWLYK